jgi:hypothetical protein
LLAESAYVVFPLRNKYLEYQELATSVSPVRGPGMRRRRRVSHGVPSRAIHRVEDEVKRCKGCCNIETAVMVFYFILLMTFFGWRLWMIKALIDWMTTVRQSQEFVFAMTDLNYNGTDTSIVDDIATIRKARTTFDDVFADYHNKLSSSQWVSAQDYLNCCGYYTGNSTLKGAATGSFCNETYSSLALAFNASCALPLENSSRSQSRLVITIIMAVGFIQAVNLVVFWEMIYPAYAVLKARIQQKLLTV